MPYFHNPNIDGISKIVSQLEQNNLGTATLRFEKSPEPDLITPLQGLIRKFNSRVNIMLAGDIQDYSFLMHLNELSGLSIFMFKEFDFNTFFWFSDLKRLRISQFSKKTISLKKYKEQLNGLELLIISNVVKENDIFSGLSSLKMLALSNNNFDVVCFESLPKLISFSIFGGELQNIEKLNANSVLKSLKIYEIKLNNLDFVSKFIHLQNLEIYDLKNIQTLPDFSSNKDLQRILIENLKISDYQPIESATNLTQLSIEARRRMDNELDFLTKMKKLRVVYLNNYTNRLKNQLIASGLVFEPTKYALPEIFYHNFNV